MPQYITIYKYIYLPKYKYYLFTYVNHELYNIYLKNKMTYTLVLLSVMAAKPSYFKMFPLSKGEISMQ